MQAVAVVEQGVQRLQDGADVVELDFLRVQGAAGDAADGGVAAR
nr:hypothetical protein [Dyella nitratireducens]